MFSLFKDLAERSEPFAHADASALWTNPHIAKQMLQLHLAEDHDVSSRRASKRHAIIDGIDRVSGLSGKTLLDLGCGPGLYAKQFVDRGADVTGVDFSPSSIAFARDLVPAAKFSVADYLRDDLGEADFDIVTLIYGDVCALAPASRRLLFSKVYAALCPGGVFILDAFSRPQFELLSPAYEIEANLMAGFWAEGEYVGLKHTLLYVDDAIALDRYLIVEPHTHWQVHNWLKYFQPDELLDELSQASFLRSAAPQSEDWSGPWQGDASPFFVVVRKG